MKEHNHEPWELTESESIPCGWDRIGKAMPDCEPIEIGLGNGRKPIPIGPSITIVIPFGSRILGRKKKYHGKVVNASVDMSDGSIDMTVEMDMNTKDGLKE